MKKIIIVILVTVCVIIALYIVYSDNTTNLLSSRMQQNSEYFPDIVAGLPLFKQNGTPVIESYTNNCETYTVEFCYNAEVRRYMPSDTSSAPWAFRVETLKLTSGNVDQQEEELISRAKTITIGKQKVYLISDTVIWFPKSATTDVIHIVLMPLTEGPERPMSDEITESHVRENENFILPFLASFPPR